MAQPQANVYEQRVMVRYVRRRSVEHFEKNNERLSIKITVKAVFFYYNKEAMTVDLIKDILNGKISFDDRDMRQMINDGVPPYEITYEELLSYFKMFMDNTFGSVYGAQGTLRLFQYLIRNSKLYEEADEELKEILNGIIYHYYTYDFFDDEGREIYRSLYNYKKPYKDKLLLDDDHLRFIKECIKKGDITDLEKDNLKIAFSVLVEHNHPEGIYILGNVYNRDDEYLGYKGDYLLAEKYLLIAGSLGISKSLSDLGFIYLDKLIEKDEEIYQVFSQALNIDNENLDSYIGVATAFKNGLGVEKNELFAERVITKAFKKANERYETLKDLDCKYGLLVLSYFEYAVLRKGSYSRVDAQAVIRAIDFEDKLLRVNPNKKDEEIRNGLYNICKKNPNLSKLGLSYNLIKDENKTFEVGKDIILRDSLNRLIDAEVIDYLLDKDETYDDLRSFVTLKIKDIVKDDEDHNLYHKFDIYNEEVITLHNPEMQIFDFFTKDGVFDNIPHEDGYISIDSEGALKALQEILCKDHDKTNIKVVFKENEARYISIFVNNEVENKHLEIKLLDIISYGVDGPFDNYYSNVFEIDYINKYLTYNGGQDSYIVKFKSLLYKHIK